MSYIIAEIANAAQGQIKGNYELIKAAKRAGADGVKFQFYKFDHLATELYPKYSIYVETFYDENTRSSFVDFAYSLDIDVWVDVFDDWGLQVVEKNLHKIYGLKVPPTVILNAELFKAILNLGKPTLVGVGGYEDADINVIMDVLYETKVEKERLILLHGYQGFPTKKENLNIRRMVAIGKKYEVKVGFADHIDATSSLAIDCPVFAVCAGASVIEKHIIMERGPGIIDAFSSLQPLEFQEMVKKIKEATTILGSNKVSIEEKDYLQHATRAVARINLSPKKLYTKSDLKFKRVDDGDYFFPNYFDDFTFFCVKQKIEKNFPITIADTLVRRVGIIVISRMSSSRLEQKALAKVGKHTLTEVIIRQLDGFRKIILATSTSPDDDVLSELFLNNNQNVVRGSLDDPLERLVSALDRYNLTDVVRVTGDSPFVDESILNALIDSHIKNNASYTSTKDLPLGLRQEVISSEALRVIYNGRSSQSHSEYLTLYFKNNPGKFNINYVDFERYRNLNHLRLNIDYSEDLAVCNKIMSLFEGQKVSMETIKHLYDISPEIFKENSQIQSTYTLGTLKAELDKETRLLD